ncbi:MAG: hypothetical protein ACR2QF_03065 [Geminicoccaceae bacterium]
MEARGLAHECRITATGMRSGGNAVDPDALAALLEQCATTLEEIDATVPALQQIQDKAVRVYRRIGRRHQGPMSEIDGFTLGVLADLADAQTQLCAYLAKESKSNA